MPVAAPSSQTQVFVLSQYLIFIPSTVSSDMHFYTPQSTVIPRLMSDPANEFFG